MGHTVSGLRTISTVELKEPCGWVAIPLCEGEYVDTRVVFMCVMNVCMCYVCACAKCLCMCYVCACAMCLCMDWMLIV